MKWKAWFTTVSEDGLVVPASPPMVVEAEAHYDAKRAFFEATMGRMLDEVSLNSVIKHIRVEKVKED